MLKKYIQPFLRNNKCFIVAYDQGLGKSTDIFKHQSQNPFYIYNLSKAINATGLIVNKGIAEIFYANRWNKVPLIIKLDYKDNDEKIIIPTCSPAYAKSIGAKAIGYTIYFGSSVEKEQIKQFAQISEQAHSFKMGVVLWAYTVEKDFSICNDLQKIKNSIRVSLELGADLIKMPKINDLTKIKEIKAVSPNLPIALRGGELISKEAFIEYLHIGLENDINGFIIGRNLWQQENAVSFGQEIQKIIFSSKK